MLSNTHTFAVNPFAPITHNGKQYSLVHIGSLVLRAKDPKVRRARVCITAAGLVLQGIAGSEHWPLDVLV